MIETTVSWILILLCASYVALHWYLWSGISRLAAPKYAGPAQGISVIIAARNEERTIGPLLDSLLALDYPAEQFEIIIANDRSTDTTGSVIASYRSRFRNLRSIDIIENQSDMPNKKNALQKAIELSSFDILAFTDADCIVPPAWLRSISETITADVGVAAGYSPYREGTANSFLRYEELKNSVMAASAAGVRLPYMCTGRNFAYRKAVYDQVGGFEKIKHSVSGDDDLFLQLVRRETQWSIRYMTSPGSAVRTVPPESFPQFIHQRARHVSASAFYPRGVKTAYAVIHLFHLSLAAGAFLAPLSAVIALMVKFNTDGAFIEHGKKLFNEEISVAEFFTDELLLVLYSFLIAPLGFLRTFRWKGTAS